MPLVNIDDSTTWRDLALEKVVKSAAKGKVELNTYENSSYGDLLHDVTKNLF